MKIKSKIYNNKFIYGDLLEHNNSQPTIFLLSGFSGGRYLSLFKIASNYFFNHNFNVLKFNFCTDPDDSEQMEDALVLKDMTFSVYLSELKNIIDEVINQNQKIILIGHSFGSVISILFLDKYKKYKKQTELILWDQSHLPWNKKEMENDFKFDARQKIYNEKNGELSFNKIFFKELITIDTLKFFQSLNKKTCIVAAQNSADQDAQKYFDKIGNKKGSELHIINETDHLFETKKSQKELFQITLDFINNKT
jgi:alpha/beta superfamily hydrolase